MRTVSGFVWRWGPVGAFVCVLYALSLDPGTPKPGTPGVDKVLHVAAYGTLGLLLARGAGGAPRWAAAVALVVLGALAGIGDEWIQSGVPGRTASVWDVVADVVGVAGGVALAAKLWTLPVVSRWV